MAETLALLPRVDSRTHYRDVHRVQPAHMLRVDATREESIRYWNPSPPRGTPGDPREYEEEARRLVDVAVASHLRGVKEIAASHLSCGLDSAIVTSSAALQYAPKRIVAFTSVPASGFRGPVPAGAVANEGPGAARIARRYENIDHALVETSVSSALEVAECEHAYLQQPLANLENAVWGRAINQAAHATGAKILLTGSVGNITISYAGMEHLGSLVRQRRLANALNAGRALAAHGVPWRTVIAYLLGPFLPPTAWKAATKWRGWITDLRDYTSISAAALSYVHQRGHDVGFDFTYRPSCDPFQARLDALSDVDAGNYCKGTLAQWGLSIRDPLADKRLIEFCLAVPVDQYLQSGVPRSLARRAFAERLPANVVKGSRRGYQSADWYIGLERDLPSLQREAEAIGRCGPAAAAMDREWLLQSLNSWPADGWDSEKVVMRYRYGLLRAVSAGHFMRRVAGTN